MNGIETDLEGFSGVMALQSCAHLGYSWPLSASAAHPPPATAVPKLYFRNHPQLSCLILVAKRENPRLSYGTTLREGLEMEYASLGRDKADRKQRKAMGKRCENFTDTAWRDGSRGRQRGTLSAVASFIPLKR